MSDIILDTPIELPTETLIENTTKYYTIRSIAAATFMGGPIAAGILARKNFINSGEAEKGKQALIIGIFATIILFVGIYAIPEEIINKIPNPIIPLIYTGIISLVLNTIQGKVHEAHIAAQGQFYSFWRAIGIGAICMVFLIAGLFSFAYFIPEDFDTTAYDAGIAEFQQNEEQAMQLYTSINLEDVYGTTTFINNIGIPAWERNIEIVNDLDTLDGLYDEFIQQNKTLREYCELRIELFNLIDKAVTEGTDSYDYEIDQLSEEINKLLSNL